MKRYSAAVILGQLNHNNSELVRGIISQAQKLDCNISVFYVFSECEDEIPHQSGEEQLYSKINFDVYDGVIFEDAEIWTDRMREKIIDILNRKCHVPVVRICSDPSDNIGFRSFCVSSRKHFSELVSHLIDVHDLHKIYCLAGTRGNFTSDERTEGYKDAMRAHGLEAGEDCIFDGDFWVDAAARLGKAIGTGSVERPEAVVCVNDYSAVSLINTLARYDIRIPEDIAVTGFDAVIDSMLSIPTVTTYLFPNIQAGQKCFMRLFNLISDRHIHEPEIGSGKLICNRSCGCGRSDSAFVTKHKNLIVSRQKYSEKFESGNMNERLMSAADINELVDAIDSLTYLINGFRRYVLCVYNPSDTGKITVLLDKNEGSDTAKYLSVSSDDLEVSLLRDREESHILFYSPVHFNEQFLGFSIIEYDIDFEILSGVYRLWNKNISDALMYLKKYSENGLSCVTHGCIPVWMRDVMREMDKPENFIEGLPRLLELSHMSQEHITREFRRYTGLSPTQHINSLRLSYAAGLLDAAKEPITQICYMSGFNNLGYFYKRFREKYGCSPGRYLSLHKNTKCRSQ
ncbi:MAG: substrate-binding domain-containing protein [Oscillospiraceae bacterium]|nr:substrate-binding domain-containing protein [Oscillospiraceae bacterium]